MTQAVHSCAGMCREVYERRQIQVRESNMHGKARGQAMSSSPGYVMVLQDGSHTDPYRYMERD